ncbi:circularly permuted type 2 ATP-grasp protein [Acuticoccus sp.]|uniref:circularly permuted type 2 ATP-grasp protein n=1 Tax=Acuticoccus sp. TaxID=1904378 RepID=UPI003B52914C
MSPGPSHADAAAQLLEHYRPSGGADELLAEGAIRSVWRPLVDAIAGMDDAEFAVRRSRAEQYLRDAGVHGRPHDKPRVGERDWPLSLVPIVVDEARWQQLADGLVARAEVLERLAVDLYGERRLIAEGHLPAQVVASNPRWLRPLVGARPRGGHWLHFLAFDVGRASDGGWRVLADRTDAPAGAGLALENRIATTRAHADLFARANVHRLAGFFRVFRDALVALQEPGSGRVGILGPAPSGGADFEQAAIARYLGFLALSGEDLTVRTGRVMVRTVAGLRPASVLWRRLADAATDPLELDEASAHGTPGLVEASRGGGVTLVNALGTGVLETRAVYAFLPRIASALTGAPLAVPNVDALWCGEAATRREVVARAGRLAIVDAAATRPSLAGEAADEPSPSALAERLARDGADLVAQERFLPSTTPLMAGRRMVPRPVVLRVFLARFGDGWTVMPGGLARVASSDDGTVLAAMEGGVAADVWVVSDRPVAAETMLLSPTGPPARQEHMPLPSRAADNLFWLGRYVERAEHKVRLLRAHHLRLADAASPDDALLAWSARVLAAKGVDPGAGWPEAVSATFAAATSAAGNIRDRFSVDGWAALDDLATTVERLAPRLRPGDDTGRGMGVVLRKLSGFSGLVHDNMYRFTGWRFLSIGRALERAMSLAGTLAAFADPRAPAGALELALEVTDSAMSHRRRYATGTSRATVVDLLALDPLNPRSIVHQMDEVEVHVATLPGAEPHRPLTPLQRAVTGTRTRVALATPDSLDGQALAALSDDLAAISDHLTAAYLR